MKSRFLLIILLFVSTIVFSQSFYDVKFKDKKGNIYYGFMVYYNESNCYMRVGYTQDNKYYVVNVEYNSFTNELDGIKAVFLIGKNPTYITQCSYCSYNPEHFFWFRNLKTKEHNNKPFYTTDPEFNNENIYTVDYFNEIKQKDLSINYLKLFYNSNEQDFINFSNFINQSNVNVNYYSQKVKPSLYLIVIANTNIGDIGASCEIDRKQITSEFEGISDILNINLKKYIIDGSKFTKNNILNTLYSIKPNSDDIVVFYYTGHGFRFNDQSDSYPYLDIRYNPYQENSINTYIALSEIYKILKLKDSRFSLILSDCCNSNIGLNQISSSSYFSTRSNQNYDKNKLYNLLIQSKGIIISAAAKPGEYSWCNPINGGFFTDSFLQSLKEEISILNNQQCNWSNIISKTIKYAQNKTSSTFCPYCKQQNGIKYIDLK